MMAALATAAPARVGAGSFYTWMALACVATAFLGYIPTYWQPLAAGKFAANPIVHIHGVAMFSWTLFALIQTSLVPTRRVALHRALGLAGISLATLVVGLGLLAALNELRTGVLNGDAQATEAFLAVPLSDIAEFATLFALALGFVRRPEFHKRLMLLATVSVLNAPVARPYLTWIHPVTATPPVWINVPVCWFSYLLIVAAMIRDWRKRGRPHVVYVVGLPVLMFVAWAVIPISQTAVWREVAKTYLALAGH
jgi:hypothetical protein